MREWVVDRVREVEEYVSTGRNAEDPDVIDIKFRKPQELEG